MSNNGLRRNNSSCGPTNGQFQPYMLGKSRGFGVSSNRMPQMVSVNTVSAPPPQQYAPPMRTSSLNSANANVSVRDCMYWPTSLNNTKIQAARNQNASYSYSNNQPPRASAGDFRYCAAPPKVYISGPGGKDKRQQNIPCQVAPLGTDPMCMIKPMEPLTVRVQAPADLFTGDPSQPKTISISPQQLYGGR